jgi:radical SAM-linked protein
MEEALPWDHLHCGVDREFLEQEWHNALARTYTPDCRYKNCQKCGLCDFKTIKPVVNTECPVVSAKNVVPQRKEQQETPFRHRVHYTRLGDSRFYGHLELLQLVFRVLHRAGLPVLFSQGYNPSPKVSFSQALPVGVESLVEHFDVELARPLNNLPETIDALNHEFPETIQVTSIELIGKGRQHDLEVSYQITLPTGVDGDIADNIATFLAAEEFIIERIRKRKRKQLDIRPLVQTLEQKGEQLEVTLVQRHSQAGISPVLLLEKVLGLSTDQARIARIIKTVVNELE